jgi:hypothetical protein
LKTLYCTTYGSRNFAVNNYSPMFHQLVTVSNAERIANPSRSSWLSNEFYSHIFTATTKIFDKNVPSHDEHIFLHSHYETRNQHSSLVSTCHAATTTYWGNVSVVPSRCHWCSLPSLAPPAWCRPNILLCSEL